MRAVMPEVPEHLLRWRKKTGADRWDEIWEGVLHMAPAPNREHQDLEASLEMWLRLHWSQPRQYRVYHQINVAAPGGWPNQDYRIPDLVLLTPDRFSIDRNEYFDGAPSVVVEIHSPGDEAFDKLSFYAGLRVPETWIVHRDTRQPEIFALHGEQYQRQTPENDGWLYSIATGVQLRGEVDAKLGIQIKGSPATFARLPQ